MILGAVVFVFSIVLFISIIDSDIDFFRWLEMHRLGILVRRPYA
jgi:hypothetical protein